MDNYFWDVYNLVKNAKEQSQIVIIKRFCSDTPKWEEFIEYIEKSSNVEESLYSDIESPLNEHEKKSGTVVKGNIMIKESFYLYISIPKGEYFNETSLAILNNISQIFEAGSTGKMSTVYINLSSNINNIAEHTDERDNFYWQCIGSTEWVCGENTYNVEPGDLVYIPSKTKHAVNFKMPRAAIGFNWNLDHIIKK